MSPLLWLRKIDILRAVMQHGVVVHELAVAALQRHRQVQCRVVAQRIKKVECFDVGRRKARRIGEALCGFDVLALIERGEVILVPAEHRDKHVWQRSFRNLTTAISSDRLEQKLQKIWADPKHFVVDRFHADEKGDSARLRRIETQQSYHVGGVCVESLPLAGLVYTHIWIRAVESNVAHVTEDVTGSILRADVSKVRSDPVKYSGSLSLGVRGHR
mmetsp:Transcript_15785/g.40558  ORF Transcript_15785/g.40558 Transcript_15785/m.40558 type:complete len:216 (-) Transcript_15785:24-671(-)